MIDETPVLLRRNRTLFDDRVTPGAMHWLGISLGYAIAIVIGFMWNCSTWILNGFIITVALAAIYRTVAWILRFRHHIRRTAQILWACTSLSIGEILSRSEADRPLALTALQAVCVKISCDAGRDHTSVLQCIESTLRDELAPLATTARLLPACGLVGTCVGMMAALHAIGVGAADLSDVESATAAIAATIPQMAIAISTTLSAAFFGSIVLTSLVSHCQAKVQKFVDELDAQLDLFPFHIHPVEESKDES